MAAQQIGEAPSKGKSYDDAFNFSKASQDIHEHGSFLILFTHCIFYFTLSTLRPCSTHPRIYSLDQSDDGSQGRRAERLVCNPIYRDDTTRLFQNGLRGSDGQF